MNDQVEVANKVLLHCLRTSTAALGGSWFDEFHNVLLSFRTTPCEATSETPYSLVYGTKAMLPIEIDRPTICSSINPADNDAARAFELNLLEEHHL